MLNVTDGIDQDLMDNIIVGLYMAHLNARDIEPNDTVLLANYGLYSQVANFVYKEIKENESTGS